MTKHNEPSFLTWLDWYVSGARKNFLSRIAPGILPFTGRRQVMSDCEAIFFIALSIASGKTPPTMLRWETGADPETALARQAFYGALLSFTCPDAESIEADPDLCDRHGINPRILRGQGVKISSRLARAFSHAQAPDSEEWRAALLRQPWYFDIPHRALLVGSRQIRSIFTQPTSALAGSIAVVAILTAPGVDLMSGRYAWMMRPPSQPGYIHGVNCSCCKRSMPSMDLRGSADVEIDRDYLQQSVENFIGLCLLYREQIAADAPELPRRDSRSAPMKKKQRIHQRRNSTLFRVVSLDAPSDNFGRSAESMDSGGGGGWQLAYQVTVRGHFRHQPHGPERSLRKLIWIDEHHRGPNRDAPVLNPLRKPHHAV